MMKTFIVLCLFCVVWVDGQSAEGDNCTTRTGQSGMCTKIPACIPVRDDLRKGIRNQFICGYEGSTRIICCPNEEATTTTAETVPARISVRKCDEYNEYSFDKVNIANTFGGGAMEDKVTNCAFTSVSLILGGTEAKLREFPHMALIGYENGDSIHWDCGGTLISEQFVLSAAHCYESRSFGPAKYIRLGEHDQNRTDDGITIDLQIIERFINPEYQWPMVYNDIGLFKLEQKVELSGAIRPACLPQVSAVPTKTAIATGWGTVEWRGQKSSVLLKVVLDMFTQSECNITSKPYISRKFHGIVEETQVCAGSRTEERKDTCQGDSGGPLQIYHDSHPCSYVIVGVTSTGKPCDTPEIPGIYTRVYAYLDWIEQIVWPDK